MKKEEVKDSMQEVKLGVLVNLFLGIELLNNVPLDGLNSYKLFKLKSDLKKFVNAFDESRSKIFESHNVKKEEDITLEVMREIRELEQQVEEIELPTIHVDVLAKAEVTVPVEVFEKLALIIEE